MTMIMLLLLIIVIVVVIVIIRSIGMAIAPLRNAMFIGIQTETPP